MREENQRRSRRIQGLGPEAPRSPIDLLPIEPHMEEEEVHSKMGSIPQLEEHIEGHVETIEEGSIPS